MSAIIALRRADRIELMTDACTTRLKDGVIAGIHSKQLITTNGVAVAGVGVWEPVVHFARLIGERTQEFDDILPMVEDLWGDAWGTLPDAALALPFATFFAGWSKARARLEVHGLNSSPNRSAADPTVYEIHENATCFAGGPDEERKAIGPFVERLCKAPDKFDPRADGVAFFEDQRRNYPRQYQVGRRPCVGGFVELMTVTRSGIAQEVLHRWPDDQVGRVIELDADDAYEARLVALLRGLAQAPHPEEIAYLRAHPQIWREFDKDFGDGAAATYLPRSPGRH